MSEQRKVGRANAFIMLNAICAAAGVDISDIIERANGDCVCGHKRDLHAGSEPFVCTVEGCGCGGFIIPPATNRDDTP